MSTTSAPDHHRANTRQQSSQRFADRVAAHDASVPGYTSAWEAFVDRVASPAEQVVPPLIPDQDLSLLLRWGRRLDGDAPLDLGRPNDCHANASRLFLAGRVDAIAIGYALRDDDLWRQHTVGWSHELGGVLETTVARQAYFVAVLSKLGSWSFAMANTDMSDLPEVINLEGFAAVMVALDELHADPNIDNSATALVTLGDRAIDAAWRAHSA